MDKCKGYKTYLITILVGAAVMATVVIYQFGQLGTSVPAVMRSISDGCFVSGIMLMGFGILTVIANAGNFYGISYLGKVMVAKLRRHKEDEQMAKTYYEYVKAKEGEKKETKFLVIVGILYLAIAVIFTVIFEYVI